MLPLMATGFGAPESVTLKSALETTFAISVPVLLTAVASPPPLTLAMFVSVAGADCDTVAFSVIDG